MIVFQSCMWCTTGVFVSYAVAVVVVVMFEMWLVQPVSVEVVVCVVSDGI